MNSSPWAKLTTSIMPKISVNPEAISARIMPVTMPFNVWISSSSYGIACKIPSTLLMLYPEILVDDRVAELERGCRAVMPDSAFLHDVDALARFQRQRHVLLHQQNRHALPVQHVDDLSDLPNHARHQPLGGLVQQDDLGLEHHRPGDGEHLLLASREGAAGLVAPLGEHGEIGEGFVEQLLLPRFGHPVAIETGAEILHHGEQPKDAAVFRYVADPPSRELVRGETGDR